MALKIPLLTSNADTERLGPRWLLGDNKKNQSALTVDALLPQNNISALAQQIYQMMGLQSPGELPLQVLISSVPLKDLAFLGGVKSRTLVSAKGEKGAVNEFLSKLQAELQQQLGGVDAGGTVVQQLQASSVSSVPKSKGSPSSFMDGLKALGLLAGLLLAISWISTRKGKQSTPISQEEALVAAASQMEGVAGSGLNLVDAERQGHGWNLLLARKDASYRVSVSDARSVTAWRKL